MYKNILLIALLLISAGCGGSSAISTSASSSSSSTVFPANFAITSPTKNSSSSSGSESAGLIKNLSSYYDVETAAINSILTATSLANCVGSYFGDLLTPTDDASCYGPQIPYIDHPDSVGVSADGTLPPGDLGIWDEVESSTTEACSAAQLNARMEGVTDKTSTALKTLASMICTINNTSSVSLPSAGSSVSIASEMNTMLAASSLSPVPTVNSATLVAASNTVGTTDYTYSINITYTISGSSVALQTNMTHRPLDATGSTYKGKLSYYYDSEDNQNNCNNSMDFGSYATSDITELGSVTYERSSSTSLKFDARTAQACGSSNTDTFDSDNILDPSEKSIIASQPGGPDTSGWAAGFTIMAADLDPTTNIGNYAFAWQAGVGDGTARTFNVNLKDSDSDTYLEGTAFFGYGEEIASSDAGTILGMYCNWAGPNGGVGNDTSKRKDLVQRQVIEENSSSGLFVVTTSDILYAPTLSCDYDGTGTFTYDSDGDGTIDTSASTPVTNSLIDPSDSTNGIAASGYTAPTAPASL